LESEENELVFDNQEAMDTSEDDEDATTDLKDAGKSCMNCRCEHIKFEVTE
jgi:hypothetical protein